MGELDNLWKRRCLSISAVLWDVEGVVTLSTLFDFEYINIIAGEGRGPKTTRLMILCDGSNTVLHGR